MKQHLAAIRRCLDWLVSGGVLDINPAGSVKGGPQHIVREGKTPLRDAEQTRHLLDSIPLHNVVGRRDRAIIGTMVFSFGRIGAVVGMNVGDYYMSGRHRMFRLHEKGGKVHQMPAHHHAIDYVEDYLDAAGLWGQQQAPLFQAVDNRKQPTGNRLDRKKALEMIKRRARAAGYHLLPHLPRHRDHHLSVERRRRGKRPPDGGPPVVPDHPTLRSAGRPGDPGRDRADPDLTASRHQWLTLEERP